MESNGLPTTDEELTQFVLAGNRFFQFDQIEHNDFYKNYYVTTVHIANHLFLVDTAEYIDYRSVLVTMRGTDERIQLNRFDQADRYLFRAVVQDILLENFRNDGYELP